MFTLRVDDSTFIRPYQPEDASALFELVAANRDSLARWFPWVDTTRSRDDVAGFIRGALEKFGRADGFEGGLWHRGDLVGSIGLHRIDRSAGETEIGYWLAESAQGRGLMTRAVATVIDAIFGRVDALERVEIRAWSENVRSRAIPERLGFHHEGTRRHAARDHRAGGDAFVDHEIYSLLRGEWAAREPLAAPPSTAHPTESRPPEESA